MAPRLCDSGHVTVTVTPLAMDDTASTTDGVPVDVFIAANDVGSAGAPTVVSGPANGTATLEVNGSITYAPTPGFIGTDTFDYEICSVASPSVCATATVTVDVAATPNQPPVVGDGTAATTATVPATGNVTVTDPDVGQTVTMTVSAAAINGIGTIDDTGAFTYTPTGPFTGIGHLHGPGLRRPDACLVRYRGRHGDGQPGGRRRRSDDHGRGPGQRGYRRQ